MVHQHLAAHGGRVPSVDLHDETFVAAPPARLRELIVDAAVVSGWFPALRTRVFMDRDDKGVRWSVSGEVDGSLEVWLEQAQNGTIVHWFVRADPPPGRATDRLRRRYVRTLNEHMFALKDQAEATGADR